MRLRLLAGLAAFALFTIGACGGTVDSPSDGDDDGGGTGRGGSGSGSGSVGSGGGGGVTVVTDASFIDDGGVVGFDDAGFGGDGGRHHRDGGSFFDGGFFDAGFGGDDGGISVLDAGVTPPPPPDGDGGPVGPRDAGTLSGPLLRDANGVVLGEIVSIQSEGAVFTIVTSTDYVVDINFDGTFPNQAFSYSGLNCTGSIWLFSGTGSRELLGNTVYYSTTKSSFLIPAGPLTDGAEVSVPISPNSESDPCSNGTGTGEYGWPLVMTTAANVGLPDTIAAPLSYP